MKDIENLRGRYVDTYEEEPVDLVALNETLQQLNAEEKALTNELVGMMKQLRANDPELQNQINNLIDTMENK